MNMERETLLERKEYLETPIGRPAVIYVPKEFAHHLATGINAAEIGSRFGGLTVVGAGEGALSGKHEHLEMVITSFGGDSPNRPAAKKEAIAKIRWLKIFLKRLMQEHNIPALYLETGEDAQMLTWDQAKTEAHDEPIGRPAIFYIPQEKATHSVIRDVEIFCTERYPFFQVEKTDGESDWVGKGARPETMFKTAFKGEKLVPELKRYLADLCKTVNEPALHVETGEDAFLVTPSNSDGEPCGRSAIFYLPKIKMGPAVQEQITKFIKGSFGNYKIKMNGATGRWQDSSTGQWHDDNNVMFKTSFDDDGADKPKIRKLKNFLAHLARQTGELAMYLETGEDAYIIEPAK